MSDLVKRLLDQANKEANELEDILNEASERIGALEAALKQAREALIASDRDSDYEIVDAINDLLKD